MSVPRDNPRFDDRALLELACGGDESAFGQLVEHHRAGLEVVCRMMVGDPEMATRTMNELVLVAWRERSAVGPSACPRAWLYRTALRVCEDADPAATCLGERTGLI